jgi:hypothetical protein
MNPMKSFITIRLCTVASLLIYPSISHQPNSHASVPNRQAQTSSPTVEGLEAFIPQGWQIEKEASGDLNNDGKADLVLQIAEVDDSGQRLRSLLILQATASGWEKIAIAPKLLFCSSCAGSIGGPKGTHIRLTIEDGVLIVNQLPESSRVIAMTHRL